MFVDKMEMTTCKPLSMTMMYNQLDEPARIMYTFKIGDSRNVYIDEDDDVTIADEDSGKPVSYTHLTLPTNREV